MENVIEKSRLRIFNILVGCLLFFSPFFKGMFFMEETTYVLLCASAITCWLLFELRQNHKEITFPDVAPWLFLLMYYVSIIYAADKGEALNRGLQINLAILVFWLVSKLSINNQQAKTFVKILYWAGVGVAFVGLLDQLGLLRLTAGFAPEGRLASTIGYPNTLAAYLGGVFILGLFLLSNQSGNYNKILLSIGNYILMLAILATQSRGGWLVFAFMLALYIIGLRGKVLAATLGSILLSISTAVFVAEQVIHPSLGQNWSGLLWFLGGAVVAVVATFFAANQAKKITEVAANRSKLIVGSLVLITGVLLVSVFIFKGMVPSELIAKVKSISLQERNVVERGYFYRDALKVIKDNWLLGIGGGGWSAVYYKYQSYFYKTKEVHNYLLQTWLEVGIIGLGLLLYVWIKTLITTVNLRRKYNDDELGGLAWAAGVAAFMVGIHSLIDFNMSIGAVSMFVWALIGIIFGIRKSNEDYNPRRLGLGKYGKWIGAGLCVGLMVITLSLKLSMSYGAKADQTKENLPTAQQAALRPLKQAMVFNPFNSNYPTEYAQLLLKVGEDENDLDTINEGIRVIDRALRLNRTNESATYLRGRLYMAKGDVDKGWEDIERCRELKPWAQESYDQLAEISLAIGSYYESIGDKEKAKDYYKKTVGVPALIQKQLAELTPETRKLWIAGPMLGESELIKQSVTEALMKL